MAPISKDGERRYPKHAQQLGRQTMSDGIDLGASILPQDIYISLRHIAKLQDSEILEAFSIGCNQVERDLGLNPSTLDAVALGELSVDERRLAIQEGRQVSRSRINAWRRRNRQMTWRELRILFIGLRKSAL